jgi:hypothetical protein
MPGQVGDLPHDTGKLLMWRRPLGLRGQARRLPHKRMP